MSAAHPPAASASGRGGSAPGSTGSGSGSASGTGSQPAAAPKPGPVSGRYLVLNSYVDNFIGEVTVTNSAASAQDWQVRLEFPSNVGDLRTAWVESHPQATLGRSGKAYIFTSTVPIDPNSSLSLRFQFDRTGSNNLASACTVNGSACAGL
jgi:cellulase/cellobiase CelA1